MDIAQYYKKADPVLGVAKILFLRLLDLFESKPISQLAKTTSGGTPNRGNAEYYGGKIPWLKSGELNDSFIYEPEEFITEEGLKSSSAKLFESGTLLGAMYGATAGKTGILKINATTNQAVCALFPNEKLKRDYLYWFLRQHRIDLILQSKGGAQPNISQKVIKNTLIPTPSLEIQNKVIDFLNEVNENGIVDPKFDILDETSFRRINKFIKIRRTNENLESKLQTQKKLVSQLKQSILQEAIQGKLTEAWRKQNPNVEPASELLKRIKAEKAQLIKDKKIRKEKPLPPISEDEIPFELPEGWVWCRIGDISHLITKGSSPKWQGIKYVDEGVLFVTSENVGTNEILLKNKKFVEHKFNNIEPRSILQKGDVLTNIVGASIGRTAIWNEEITANINQAVCLVRFPDSSLNKQYLVNILNSDFGIRLMMDNQFDTGRGNLSLGAISKFKIPFPPLAEQKVIVEKVERLMQKCYALEQEIAQSEQHANMLMQAVLKEAFEGEKKIED